MRFADFKCSTAIAEKLWSKHHVDLSEVHDVLEGDPFVRRGPLNFHYVYGRTAGGRYLVLVVLDLGHELCRIATARDMDDAERRLYRRR